jgi:hypothetical protein
VARRVGEFHFEIHSHKTDHFYISSTEIERKYVHEENSRKKTEMRQFKMISFRNSLIYMSKVMTIPNVTAIFALDPEV